MATALDFGEMPRTAAPRVTRLPRVSRQAVLNESRVGDHHHHTVCRSCGIVVDADSPA